MGGVAREVTKKPRTNYVHSHRPMHRKPLYLYVRPSLEPCRTKGGVHMPCVWPQLEYDRGPSHPYNAEAEARRVVTAHQADICSSKHEAKREVLGGESHAG